MGRGHEDMLTNLHDLLRRVVEPDLAAFERRDIEDVVQQRQQHFGIVDHDGAVFGALLLREFLALHERREADDGVQRSTYLMAHIGQKGRFEHIGLLGFLAGDHQLAFALFERALETPRTQEQERHEDQQQHQQYDSAHEQLDIVRIFREFGSHRILDNAALRQGVFGDLQLLELARVEDIFAVREVEVHTAQAAGLIVLLDLGGDDVGPVLVVGHEAAHSHVADARAGDREDRKTGVELHQIVERTLHEVFAVAAHAPRAQHHGRPGRKRRIGRMRSLVAVAAVHQHKIQVGIILHLLTHERLQRDAAVGVVRNKGDVLDFGIERTDQLDVAAHVVFVEQAAHIVQAVHHIHVVDRPGHPDIGAVGRRRKHDAVRTDKAAEAHHLLGNASQRDERRPRLLPQQHDGPQAPFGFITGYQVVGLRNPEGRVVDALAFERLDVNIARHARRHDLTLEFRDETRHAARVGIVGRNDQNALPSAGLLGPKQRGQQNAATQEQQRPVFYRSITGHSFFFYRESSEAIRLRSSSARSGLARHSLNPA